MDTLLLSIPPLRTPSLDEQGVRAALALVLSSPGFSKAGRMRRLLQYLVERQLRGDLRATSEYAIGIEVFERNPAWYSTCGDPIVRVQVGRLRDKLKAYYAGPGAQARVRIDIPVGSYMPIIALHVPAPAGSRPRLLAAPLVCLSGDAGAAAFTRELNEELGFQLFQAFGQRVVSAERAASHRLEGSLRRQGEALRLCLRVLDSAAGCIAWARQFDRQAPLELSLQEELAGAICAELRGWWRADLPVAAAAGH